MTVPTILKHQRNSQSPRGTAFAHCGELPPPRAIAVLEPKGSVSMCVESQRGDGHGKKSVCESERSLGWTKRLVGHTPFSHTKNGHQKNRKKVVRYTVVGSLGRSLVTSRRERSRARACSPPHPRTPLVVSRGELKVIYIYLAAKIYIYIGCIQFGEKHLYTSHRVSRDTF